MVVKGDDDDDHTTVAVCTLNSDWYVTTSNDSGPAVRAWFTPKQAIALGTTLLRAAAAAESARRMLLLVGQYDPDRVSHPGETLADVLIERGITQADLARRMVRPKKTINEIIAGKAAITLDTARSLDVVLDIPAAFWMERQAAYDAKRFANIKGKKPRRQAVARAPDSGEDGASGRSSP